MDDAVRQLQNLSRLEYENKQQNTQSPPLRIGEYHQETGRYKVIYPNGGTVIAGKKLFTSSVPDETIVRANQAYGSQSISLDYKNHIPLGKEEKQQDALKGFLVWNTGYTKPTWSGYADLAVDFFSGLTDRNKDEWKKCKSNDDFLPNIKGLKLIYIPMMGKSLSPQEVQRIKQFNRDGGIVFVTGEHSDFFLERRKANEIMQLLNSPLRCVDTNNSYVGLQSFNYSAKLQDKTYILYGNASCQVIGGTPISFLPAGTASDGSNPTNIDITWIAYHKPTRTILSGDVDWASGATPSTGNDNAAFAQALLKLKW
jgi:hypothetical protein